MGNRESLSGVQLEVFHNLFAAAAEEMGVSLMRSAFSQNIKERRDFSCALFDAEGRMVAQAAHLPVHLGSAPLSVAAAREAVEMQPGDAVLLNDPFKGGTHLPDLTLVSPVFLGGSKRPDFYCANRAHHADVGGQHPGSMAPALDVHAEGLRIPPVRLVKGGVLVEETAGLLLANMRVPHERRGDLLAQWAANRVGAERLEEMAQEYGARVMARRAAGLLDWTEALMDVLLKEIPQGEWEFSDSLDAGEAGEIGLHLLMQRRRGELIFDFRGCDDQGSAPVNTPRAVAVSAVFYLLRLLLPPGTPTNEGILRPVRILTRPGSVVDAVYPAPVAAGNVETSQRLVDVLLGAAAQVFGDRIPAASAGTMSNLSFGVRGREDAFTYYETIGGGAGGGPGGPGAHALQTHMTNTRNTPVEVLESQLPVRVHSNTVRRGSGGAGEHRGGDGITRSLEFLVPVELGWIASRQRRGPWGLRGGMRGAPGRLRVRVSAGAKAKIVGSQASLSLGSGAVIEVGTPGGGGFGSSS
jgi:N-methylhydantoinase B